MVNIYHEISKLSAKYNGHLSYPGGGLYKYLPSFNSKCKSEVAHLILQVHDELIYEVHVGHVEEVARIIKCSMENALQLSVPLEVKLEIGDSWANMIPFEFHST